MAGTSKNAGARPTRAGVSIEARRASDGSTRFYARFTDPRGRRCVAPPHDGGNTWSDWGEAFAAACARQAEAERLSYRSRDGERILFRDLVAHHYLPSIKDAAPNTRKNTASHLGDGTGVPVRDGHYARRAARSQLLFAFGAVPIGAIGPNEVQQWISQMAVDGYDHATMRAKRSLLKDHPAGRGRPGMAVAQRRRAGSAAQGRGAAERGPGDHSGGVGPDQAEPVR